MCEKVLFHISPLKPELRNQFDNQFSEVTESDCENCGGMPCWCGAENYRHHYSFNTGIATLNKKIAVTGDVNSLKKTAKEIVDIAIKSNATHFIANSANLLLNTISILEASKRGLKVVCVFNYTFYEL